MKAPLNVQQVMVVVTYAATTIALEQWFDRLHPFPPASALAQVMHAIAGLSFAAVLTGAAMIGAFAILNIVSKPAVKAWGDWTFSIALCGFAGGLFAFLGVLAVDFILAYAGF